jgi:flavodoxin
MAGIVLGGIFGITLMLWICIQFLMFPANFMDITFFIFGFFQALMGYAAYVFYHQESLVVDIKNYPNIGTNPKRLVVFFSRLGYTRRAAYEAANKSGAEFLEIKTSEPTDGTSGFFWCGWFAMHRWEMPIEKIPDISRYEHITICSPIWIFGMSSPIRTFCRQAKGKIKAADYVFIHFSPGSFSGAGKEMDKILGIVREKQTDICCRFGRIAAVKEI